MLEKFRFINYSLAVILGFAGVKMLLIDYFHIAPGISLAIIAAALAGGIIASIYIKPTTAEEKELKEFPEKEKRQLEEEEAEEKREKSREERAEK